MTSEPEKAVIVALPGYAGLAAPSESIPGVGLTNFGAWLAWQASALGLTPLNVSPSSGQPADWKTGVQRV